MLVYHQKKRYNKHLILIRLVFFRPRLITLLKCLLYIIAKIFSGISCYSILETIVYTSKKLITVGTHRNVEVHCEIRLVKLFQISKFKYNQTSPCGHLYLAVTCIKRSPFYFSVIENFTLIEPHLRGHMSYKATFSLS